MPLEKYECWHCGKLLDKEISAGHKLGAFILHTSYSFRVFIYSLLLFSNPDDIPGHVCWVELYITKYVQGRGTVVYIKTKARGLSFPHTIASD